MSTASEFSPSAVMDFSPVVDRFLGRDHEVGMVQKLD
jgi:hypothetical protein